MRLCVSVVQLVKLEFLTVTWVRDLVEELGYLPSGYTTGENVSFSTIIMKILKNKPQHRVGPQATLSYLSTSIQVAVPDSLNKWPLLLFSLHLFLFVL